MKCFECGKPAKHKHHVVPASLGGTKTVPLCKKCHKKVHAPDQVLSLGALSRRQLRNEPKVTTRKLVETVYPLRGRVTLKEVAKKYKVTINVVWRIWHRKGKAVNRFL